MASAAGIGKAAGIEKTPEINGFEKAPAVQINGFEKAPAVQINGFEKAPAVQINGFEKAPTVCCLRQGPVVPLVHTLELTEPMKLKPEASYFTALRQGQPPMIIPCSGLVRTIPRCLPQIPKQVVLPKNLGIEDVDRTALEVQAALKAKGPPSDDGPEHPLRSIRATVAVLKENQDEEIRRQGLMDKISFVANLAGRVVDMWDKLPKLFRK